MSLADLHPAGQVAAIVGLTLVAVGVLMLWMVCVTSRYPWDRLK